MITTARRSISAVAVLAVLGIAWASPATFNLPSAASGARASDGQATDAAAPGTTTPAAEPDTRSGSAAATTPSTTSATQPAAPAAEAVPPAATRRGHASASDQPSGCDSGQGSYQPTTEAEFRTVMTRAWLLCQAPSFFGTDDAGLEIRADGRWSKLTRTSNGSLARAGGWGNEGTWDTVDTSAMNGRPTFQINFQVGGGGQWMTTPVFGDGSAASQVSKMRLDSYAGGASYVAAPEGTKILPVPAGADPAPASGCDRRETSYWPSSEAEFRTMMTGVWLLCRTPSFFGTDEAGLEIRADGRWSKLRQTPNGSLVRPGGEGNEGTWDTVDTSAMNGRPTFQINFYLGDGGWIAMVPSFATHGSQVSKIRLNNYEVFVADYVPAPAGRPITDI